MGIAVRTALAAAAIAVAAGSASAQDKVSEPVVAAYKEAVRKAGYDPDKVLGDFRATLKKYDALAQ